MMRNLFLLFALMPLMANADIQPNAQGNWFIEGRYQKSLSEASGWKDNTFGGIYRYSTATGEGLESLNSVGAAIGRRFANQKTSVLLTY